MRLPLLHTLLLLAVGCARDEPPERIDAVDSAAATTASCGVTAGTTLTGEGLGALRIGAPVDSVKARCNVLRDTTVLAAEGLPARLLSVDLGRDTVRAEIVDDLVWRLTLTGAAFRTADSLGVGTPLSRLLTIPGIEGAAGEDAFYVLSPERCGLSFGLHDVPRTAAVRGGSAASLRKLPPNSAVDRVLVVGC